MFTSRALVHAQERIRVLESQLAKLYGDMIELRKSYAESSTAALRAEMDNLTGRVESIAASNRKEFGRLWYQLRGQTPAGGRADDEIPTDREFQQLLELQRQHSGGN